MNIDVVVSIVANYVYHLLYDHMIWIVFLIAIFFILIAMLSDIHEHIVLTTGLLILIFYMGPGPFYNFNCSAMIAPYTSTYQIGYDEFPDNSTYNDIMVYGSRVGDSQWMVQEYIQWTDSDLCLYMRGWRAAELDLEAAGMEKEVEHLKLNVTKKEGKSVNDDEK